MAERNGRVTIATFPTPQGTGRVSLLGNSAFAAEYLVAYEAGYRWQARRNLSFDVAAYYNDYEDIYAAVRGSKAFDPNLYFSNSQEGTGHGLESAVTWQPWSWLTLFLSYNWQELDINYKDPAIENGLGRSNPTTNVPEHQAALRSAVDFNEHWQGNLWLRYVDGFLGRNSVEPDKQIDISAQYYFDANLTWKPVKNIEIMLAGQNLLNSSQLQYVAELLVPATEIERVVYTKITWSF
jgi:iron complex outermembrane receptor protein